MIKPAEKAEPDNKNNIVFQKAPHELLKTAPPFLFVDRVHEFYDDILVCSKQVGYNEPYFAGHFPGNPVVPGVLVVEMATQASALLMTARPDSKLTAGYLVRIKDFTFYHQVKPGDCLSIRVELKEETGNYVTTKALVTFWGEKKKVARGEVILYLT